MIKRTLCINKINNTFIYYIITHLYITYYTYNIHIRTSAAGAVFSSAFLSSTFLSKFSFLPSSFLERLTERERERERLFERERDLFYVQRVIYIYRISLGCSHNTNKRSRALLWARNGPIFFWGFFERFRSLSCLFEHECDLSFICTF